MTLEDAAPALSILCKGSNLERLSILIPAVMYSSENDVNSSITNVSLFTSVDGRRRGSSSESDEDDGISWDIERFHSNEKEKEQQKAKKKDWLAEKSAERARKRRAEEEARISNSDHHVEDERQKNDGQQMGVEGAGAEKLSDSRQEGLNRTMLREKVLSLCEHPETWTVTKGGLRVYVVPTRKSHLQYHLANHFAWGT